MQLKGFISGWYENREVGIGNWESGTGNGELENEKWELN